MTNSDVKQFLDKFGKRVKCINLDNTRHIFLNLKNKFYGGHFLNDITNENISFETIGDEDYLVVSRKDPNGVSYKSYHVTATIQYMAVADDEDSTIDAINLK